MTASTRPRTGSSKLDCWIHGQRVRKSFGRISEKLARDLATAERTAVLRGQAGILPPVRRDVTFERAVREYRERHLPSLRVTTRRAYGQERDRLAAHFGAKRLGEIGPLRVVDMTALRALAPPSLRPRSQPVRPPGPHAAAPLEPQAQLVRETRRSVSCNPSFNVRL